MLCDITLKSARHEELLLDLLRQASGAERSTLTCWLTAAARRRCREEIARKNPHLNTDELKLKFIEVQYGKELADEVGNYLLQREQAVAQKGAGPGDRPETDSC